MIENIKLRDLVLKEFYVDENRYYDNGFGLGGLGIITPNQAIHVWNLPDLDVASQKYIDGLAGHWITSCVVHAKMFKLEFNLSDTYNHINSIVKSALPGMSWTYITIRYGVQIDNNFIDIQIPTYITPYQLEQLEKLRDNIMGMDIQVGVNITDFDPRTCSFDKSFQSILFDEDDALQTAINYLKNNNRVIPYQLNNNENIIETGKLVY